ncbi:MAG TPA: MFS transporter [Rickettsia endosymbiont of Pyrocoelia pectoralis]|nr:MFS transporter [Rickettsia endosymbiont of Pyrocoelia pectoralis]
MLGYAQEQRNLTREQKQAVGLLSIGTFLEQFDLMLYVHMSVLINGIFFSPTSTYSMKMLSAFAFCSTFVFRPFGAILFGWIGDNIGRRATIIITTFMMACACAIMAVLPSYKDIGFTASILLTLCRIAQGMSSLGELTGAEMYAAETIKPPIQYPAVAAMTVACVVGSVIALAVASLVTSNGFNWRYAFGFGAFVAIIGTIARTTLRETPEFLDAKRRIKSRVEKTGYDSRKIEDNIILKEKVSYKTTLAYFLVQCTWPVWFYFGYIYCGDILHDKFNYTEIQVIHNNLLISIAELTGAFILSYLSYKIYPLKILRASFVILVIFICAYPFIMPNITNPTEIVIIQIFFLVFAPGYFPAASIFFKHFPVFKRFTYVSLIMAFSRAFMYVVSSIGLVFLTDYFGHWGLLVLIVPTSIGYHWGLRHFENLEKSVLD